MKTLYTTVLFMGYHEDQEGKNGVTFKPDPNQFITEAFFIEMSKEEVKKYSLYSSVSFTIG